MIPLCVCDACVPHEACLQIHCDWCTVEGIDRLQVQWKRLVANTVEKRAQGDGPPDTHGMQTKSLARSCLKHRGSCRISRSPEILVEKDITGGGAQTQEAGPIIRARVQQNDGIKQTNTLADGGVVRRCTT